MKDRKIDNIVKIDQIHSADNAEKVVVIDFYRLTVLVYINENVIIDNYRIIDWSVRYLFLYVLVRPCRNRTGDRGRGWLEI